MNELLKICQDIQKDLQELKTALVSLKLIPKAFGTSYQNLEWLRTDQVIQMLGITNQTLYRLTSANKLPFTKVGGIIYIKHSDVDRLLNENYTKDRRWKMED